MPSGEVLLGGYVGDNTRVTWRLIIVRGVI